MFVMWKAVLLENSARWETLLRSKQSFDTAWYTLSASIKGFLLRLYELWNVGMNLESCYICDVSYIFGNLGLVYGEIECHFLFYPGDIFLTEGRDHILISKTESTWDDISKLFVHNNVIEFSYDG